MARVLRSAGMQDLNPSAGNARAMVLVALLCLGVASSFAGEIKKEFPTGANPSLLLRNKDGGITVKTWDRNEIQIIGRPSSDSIEVMIVPSGQRVSVQTHFRRDRLMVKDAHVDFDIFVPHEASVRIDSERGQVSIENVMGNIAIEGVSNSVILTNNSGHIMARTVDGPILLRSCDGHIEAHSISGDLKFFAVNASEFVATTNSGKISYEGDFGSGGRYVLTTNGSPIDILTSDKASFELTARSMQGFIESNIPFRPSPLGQPFRRLSPDKFLQGLFQSGDSTVQITSYSGTIRLRGTR